LYKGIAMSLQNLPKIWDLIIIGGGITGAGIFREA
jgi:glycerol-3-phosphate dehydrogenase